MKNLLAILGCWVAALVTVTGQGISVQVLFDQEQYLPGESLVVKVRITNFTGQPLQLGTDDDWLNLTVENSKRLPVAKRASLPVRGEFTLDPSMTGTKRVEIAPYFDITQPDRYYVTATLMVSQWRQ